MTANLITEADQIKNFIERQLPCVKLGTPIEFAEFVSALYDRLNGHDIELPPIVVSFDLSAR